MKHVRYATLSFPGIFMPETETVKVNPHTAAISLFRKHKRCYRIDFFTRAEGEVDGEKVTGKDKPEPTFYLCGVAYTLAQMEAKRPALDPTLLSNVRCNGWKGAVHCRPGNWQPWDVRDDMEVITP